MISEPQFSSNTADRFSSFVAMERSRHSKRLYTAIFVALLIACLLYETQWLKLRPGLLMLLIGQLGDVLGLSLRNVRLAHDLEQTKAEGLNEAALRRWFEREESFIRRLALFDGSCQTIGFLALGYAFWVSTHSLGVALAIGVIYPVASYMGITRRKTLEGMRRLRAKKQELEML